MASPSDLLLLCLAWHRTRSTAISESLAALKAAVAEEGRLRMLEVMQKAVERKGPPESIRGNLGSLSAMSMLGAKDRETRSYLEIVDTLRQHGAAPKEDMEQLWRRIVFSILISNTDDHLRNHGFLYAGRAGWRLSPAYDLNPVPVDIKPRILTTAINEDDGTASLDLAMSVADYFELEKSNAKAIAAHIGKVVSTLRDEAVKHGLGKTEIERMASAFEHADLKGALGK